MGTRLVCCIAFLRDCFLRDEDLNRCLDLLGERIVRTLLRPLHSGPGDCVIAKSSRNILLSHSKFRGEGTRFRDVCLFGGPVFKFRHVYNDPFLFERLGPSSSYLRSMSIDVCVFRQEGNIK